jgi:hypothetical protein
VGDVDSTDVDSTEGMLGQSGGVGSLRGGDRAVGVPGTDDDDVDPAGGPAPFAEADADEEPFEVPEPPVTADPVVDEAVRRVAAAARQPLDTQVAVYDAVHRALQDRLADVED